jgi:hypothetical protein
MSAAVTTCALLAAMRARIAAVRSSSMKLCGKVSVPMPRLTPAARYRPKSSSNMPRRENTGRAMRHGGASLGKIGEIVSGGPVQPRVMIEKNRVPDDRIVAEHHDLAQPSDRCLAVPLPRS